MENSFLRKLAFAKSEQGGTSDYSSLSNKPQINGVTLDGNKTADELGLGQKYTAGTNIEITEDNVINNSIPYVTKNGSSVGLGPNATPSGYNGVAIGAGSRSDSYAISIGSGAKAAEGNIAIGLGASTYNANGRAIVIGNNSSINRNHIGSIAIGHGNTENAGATIGNTTKSNQVMFGSGEYGINEVAMRTTDGTIKTLATTDMLEGIGGGATYTAGTNIEITEDNVINNTIPYTNGGIYNNVFLGYQATGSSTDNVAIGRTSMAKGGSHVAIGSQSKIYNGTFNISIGYGASISGVSNSVVLGAYAIADQSNQLKIGSTNCPINIMNVVTSDGVKEIATTDLVTALAERVSALEAQIATK